MKTTFFFFQRIVMRLEKFNSREKVISGSSENLVSAMRAGQHSGIAARSGKAAASGKRFQLPGGRPHGDLAQTPSNLM